MSAVQINNIDPSNSKPNSSGWMDKKYKKEISVTYYARAKKIGRNKFFAYLRELGMLDEMSVVQEEYLDLFNNLILYSCGRKFFSVALTIKGVKYFNDLLTPDLIKEINDRKMESFE